MEEKLIAPCGMNCSLCYGYQRVKDKCSGCRDDSSILNVCKRCIIRNFENLLSNHLTYCYECNKYSCLRLKQLDKRYRTKYHMSMISNLNYIKEYGINSFLVKEESKWKCSRCNLIICVHHKTCGGCLNDYEFGDIYENN